MKTKIFILTLVVTVLFSCSDEKKVTKTLPGVWNVDKIEFTSASDVSLSYSAENVGTITFNKDGSGKNNLTFTIANEDYNDNEAFKWENTDETVTIIGNANSGAKETVFTIDDFEKDTQVWTNVETDNDKLTYTLTRQD